MPTPEEPKTTDKDDMSAFAKNLFAPDPDETDEQQKPPGGNHVPREGNNPAVPPDGDMREFVRDLFGDDLN